MSEEKLQNSVYLRSQKKSENSKSEKRQKEHANWIETTTHSFNEERERKLVKNEKCLGFVDSRAMISEDSLALGVETGIRRRNVAGGSVAGGGGIILGRISHCWLNNNWAGTRKQERNKLFQNTQHKWGFDFSLRYYIYFVWFGERVAVVDVLSGFFFFCWTLTHCYRPVKIDGKTEWMDRSKRSISRPGMK